MNKKLSQKLEDLLDARRADEIMQRVIEGREKLYTEKQVLKKIGTVCVKVA